MRHELLPQHNAGVALEIAERRITEWKQQRNNLLDLSFLGLESIPDSVFTLHDLRRISFRNNKLTSIPSAISSLLSLEEIWLANNLLESLPSELLQLPSLNALFLHGNPRLELPEEILGPTVEVVANLRCTPKPPKEILDYYFATRGTRGTALRELKLIVVGWGKAGKTTLVRRLAGKSMDPLEPETHGILISPLSFECADGPISARVWDFGGQHVLHAMHEFFLTARTLYLLVLEQRSDRAESDAKYWLQLIRSYAPDAPVVVALNKSRGIEKPIDKDSLESQYGPIIAWIATECLPDSECKSAESTIDKLREALSTAAGPKFMPEARNLFPKRWTRIKDWLENLESEGLNFVSYEEFSAKCREAGELEPNKQLEIASLMHDLGIAMNYARDPRLRDTSVLRPDWLANGIYTILRANTLVPGKLLVPDGILTVDIIGSIYKIASMSSGKMIQLQDYPPEKWSFMLKLMSLFQLAFPLSEDGSQQICPALLGVEPPKDTEEPEGENTIKLRYEFDVVPAPLMPRLLVQMFPLIVEGKIWQRGAILRYLNSFVKVWTNPEDKYIFATVAGQTKDVKELLNLLQDTLAALFSEYRCLEVTEQRWFDNNWVPSETLKRFNVKFAEDDNLNSLAEGDK